MTIGSLLLQCLLTAVTLHSQLILTAGENNTFIYTMHIRREVGRFTSL